MQFFSLQLNDLFLVFQTMVNVSNIFRLFWETLKKNVYTV